MVNSMMRGAIHQFETRTNKFDSRDLQDLFNSFLKNKHRKSEKNSCSRIIVGSSKLEKPRPKTRTKSRWSKRSKTPKNGIFSNKFEKHADISKSNKSRMSAFLSKHNKRKPIQKSKNKENYNSSNKATYSRSRSKSCVSTTEQPKSNKNSRVECMNAILSEMFKENQHNKRSQKTVKNRSSNRYQKYMKRYYHSAVEHKNL